MSETVKVKPFVKADFENNLGMNFFLGTKRDIYEGEIIAVNDENLTIQYFNGVKDENRELDIPYRDILWAKEDI